jgi:hypothetical protein
LALVQVDRRLSDYIKQTTGTLVDLEDRFINVTADYSENILFFQPYRTYIYKLPNGMYHTNHDICTRVTVCGTQYWYKYGKLHRDYDKPALIGTVTNISINHTIHSVMDCCNMGTKGPIQFLKRYRYNKLFRSNDLPSSVWVDVSHEWWANSVMYREFNL